MYLGMRSWEIYNAFLSNTLYYYHISHRMHTGKNTPFSIHVAKPYTRDNNRHLKWCYTQLDCCVNNFCASFCYLMAMNYVAPTWKHKVTTVLNLFSDHAAAL